MSYRPETILKMITALTDSKIVIELLDQQTSLFNFFLQIHNRRNRMLCRYCKLAFK